METLTINTQKIKKNQVSNCEMFANEEETLLTPYGLKRIQDSINSGRGSLDELKKMLNYDNYSFA